VESEVAVATSRPSSMEEMYALYGPGAGRLAYLLTGDLELAQDLVQEVFARLMIRFGSLRNPDAIGAYVRRSVVNLSRKHWRRVRREREFVRRQGPALVRLTTSQPDVPGRDALWEALNRLPHRQRAALVLRFYEDLAERQTAEALGCSIGTVKSRVSRGLRALRDQMREEEG
jgi:RNA polymerase sigma-70 factor (sigma-E family)